MTQAIKIEVQPMFHHRFHTSENRFHWLQDMNRIVILLVLVLAFANAPFQQPLAGQELADKASPFEQLQQDLAQQAPANQLASILQFHRNAPKHPQTPELERKLRELGHEPWLQAASGQMLLATPEDAGFVDGWLPIASAWLQRGNDAEARDAMRHARESLPRFASVNRLVESTMDVCQHDGFDRQFASQLLSEAIEICEQVADEELRGVFLADLSGIAATLGLRELSAQALGKSLNLIERKGVQRRWETAILQRKLRAAAWYEPPSRTLALAKDLERIHSIKPKLVADAYIDVAISAAKRKQRTEFVKALLLTESILAAEQHRNSFIYGITARSADAHLNARRWQAAVTIANNVPDPKLQSSILFRVLISAPQMVWAPELADLLRKSGDARWAVPAVSAYVEHQLRTGKNLLDLLDWIEQLPLTSQKAAALAGISRVSGSFSPQEKTAPEFETKGLRPKPSDPRDLLVTAEYIASDITDPIQAAFAWLQVARTARTLGMTASYQRALEKIDDRLFDAWKKVWQERPPVKRSYDGTYYDDDVRYRRTDEIPTVNDVIVCLRHVSEMQIAGGDFRGAMDTFLNLANAAGFIEKSDSFGNWSFLHIEALTNRTASQTGIGPDVFKHDQNRHSVLSRPIVSAWENDVAALTKRIPVLDAWEQNEKRDRLPHATGELAMLHARQGDIDGYRSARRAALSQIAKNESSASLKNVLACADVLAGEFALAESNLASGFVPWFGDSNRPRSMLAVAYANKQQLESAIQHATQTRKAKAFYRGNAWEAVAKAKVTANPESATQALTWTLALESLNDQVSGLCGMALAADTRP